MMKSISAMLLIEDDESTMLYNKLVIRRYRIAHKVYTAANGEEGIALLKQLLDAGRLDDLPTVILLDLHMPILGGFGFLEIFNQMKMPKTIKIIMASSTPEITEIQRRDTFNRIDRIVKKPIGKTEWLTIRDLYGKIVPNLLG